MKSVTRGHVKAGLDSLRGAKVRNFWTMLGVIIGVASVITVVGIGEGIKAQISGQLHHLGNNIITIVPSTLGSNGGYEAGNASLISTPGISGTLSSKDVDSVINTKGVAKAVPLSAISADVHGQNGEYHSGAVIGTSSDLPDLLNQSMAFGVFLTDNDVGQNAAVLGSDASQALFKEDVPLGSSFTINGRSFIVRGIFNSFQNAPLSGSIDFNKAIFIPYDVSQSMTHNTAVTYQILAEAQNHAQLNQVAAAIKSRLLSNHGGQHNFSVSLQSQNLANSNSIVDLLTKLISGIAAISLLVGGIGIMNVMFVSVSERMHEIGIRKALGATNRQIYSQFLIESTVISLSGGVIGIIIALLIDVGLRVSTTLTPMIDWQIVVIATGVSLLVGVVFGFVPAYKAARKDPIDALRAD